MHTAAECVIEPESSTKHVYTGTGIAHDAVNQIKQNTLVNNILHVDTVVEFTMILHMHLQSIIV